MPIVYRDSRTPIDPRRTLDRLRRRAADAPPLCDPDAAVALLIDVAECESAIVDAICPDRDTTTPLIEALRAASCAAARVWLDAHEGWPIDSLPLRAALDDVRDDAVPQRARVSISEGFAYYALFAESYVCSMGRMLSDVARANVCTIGLRNIGTALAAVASAVICARGCRSSSFTVRPRAHPFARELRLDAPLRDALRSEAAGGAHFAILDEGPGMSGSSFAAAANALSDLGIPRERIILFPSWLPSAEALSSHDGRAVWSSHRKYWTSAEDAGVTAVSAFGVTSPSIDFSAGQWRGTVIGDSSRWPHVQPQHERVKSFVPSERRLLKFAGLGRYGAAARDRAHALADARLGERPTGLRAGFISLPFVEGTPLAQCGDEGTARDIGDYIGRVAAIFPAIDADARALAEMVDVNTRELLGQPPPDPPDTISRGVEIDGRMLAHEWIRMSDGRLVKIDALDHHRDHFFPGVQSPAWDLTGAIVELRMNARQISALLARYEAVSGDREARAQLRYFQLAYAVFRAGYCTVGGLPADRYSQWALNAIACCRASSKSPRKQIARSSMNT